MFDEDKSLLYRFRMYMFGQKYSSKEKFIMGFSFILMNAGYGIAGPCIINFLNLESTNEINGTQAIQLFTCLVTYMTVAYVVILHIVRFITETIISVFNCFRNKKRNY